MKLSRRETLGCFILGAPILAVGVSGRLLAAEDKPFIVILNGITPSTSPERFLAGAKGLLSRQIPVGCAIDLHDQLGNPWRADSDLVALLRRLSTTYPGLVELVVHVPGIVGDKPYFQIRRASEAQNDFRRALESPGEPEGTRPHCLTLLTDEAAEESDPVGSVRAAGFRNVLFLPRQAGPRGFWEEPMGVMQIHGGFEIAIQSGANAISAVIAAEIDQEEPGLAYLSVSETADFGNDALSGIATAIGDAIAAEMSGGRIYCTLPSELHRQSGSDYARYVALRVDEPRMDRPVPDDYAAFATALRQAGIPFSYAGRLEDDDDRPVAALIGAAGAGIGVCPMLRPQDLMSENPPRTIARRLEDAAALQESPATCVVVPSAGTDLVDKISAAGAGIVSEPCETRWAPAGLDRNGLLDLPATICLNTPNANAAQVTETLGRAIGTARDALVVVDAGAIATAYGREAIVGAFADLANGRENILLNVEQFGRRVMPADAAFDLLKLMKSENALADFESGGVDPAERAELMKDAEIAWRYFALLTDKETGLIPATAWLQDNLVAYPLATMWDVGSTLIGLIGAHSIGIIDTKEFTERVEKALAHISDSTIRGLRLPRLQTPTNGKGSGEDGFDASDTGRLLICLKVLERYAGTGLGVQQIVERWDLGGTLIGNRLHSIRHGAFEDVHGSNYAHYVARGFIAWGFTVAPVYPISPVDKATDAEMRLVYEVADRGPVGTEPHVLEQIELGYSDAARTIADMLYTAQLRAYAANGEVVCVSEGPLNRDPWFTYQGYQIGAEEDAWTVETIDNLAKYKTASFRQSTRMVSSKGAFLWSAVRPQAYSRILLSYVRERAAIARLGYASGIFAATGQPTANYSDVNTNGIILSAIAYILGGRTPLLAVGMPRRKESASPD